MIMIHPMVIFGTGVASMMGSVGFGIYKQKKLEEAITKISDDISVNLDDALVREMAERAIKKECAWRMDSAADRAIAGVQAEITKQVREAVNKEYTDIRASVKKEVEKQVGNINISAVRKEVIEEAKNTAAEKFKDDLDSVIESTLEKYNANLNQIKTIYESIANTLQTNSTKGTTLTIG